MDKLKRYSDEELFEILDSDVEQEIKSRGYEFGWHKKIQYAGVIYILVNPAFSNLVKIGYTENIETRLKSLNRSSGLPDPFHVYATYKVKKKLEDLKLHSLIDDLDSDLRHAKNREFYEMTPEKAYGILSAIAQINGDDDLLSLNPLNDSFFNEITEAKTENKPINEQTNLNEKIVVPDGIYHMVRKIKRWDNKEVTANVIVKNGKWIVQPGSIICPIYGGGGGIDRIKKQRVSANIENDVLLEPIEFLTPSGAADFCVGGPTDGWTAWMTEDNRVINIYRKNINSNRVCKASDALNLQAKK